MVEYKVNMRLSMFHFVGANFTAVHVITVKLYKICTRKKDISRKDLYVTEYIFFFNYLRSKIDQIS